MHLVCHLRDGDHVFETYWTTRRGVEAMDYGYALMDLTVYGRQELWEDSPRVAHRPGHTRRPHPAAEQRTPHPPVAAPTLSCRPPEALRSISNLRCS
ncbi:DUF899 family protein [Streptomyces cyaneogriseus]|uniref:DUF899 family protein n=1 Tax=Streptomyces cyaneogriseus TaxID=68192 RepID=UPI000A9165E0